jgi:hypothetical protein
MLPSCGNLNPAIQWVNRGKRAIINIAPDSELTKIIPSPAENPTGLITATGMIPSKV